MNKELELEREKLNEVKKEYEKNISKSEKRLNNLHNIYRDKEELFEEKFRLEGRIFSLNTNKEKPYFARIDFKSSNIIEKCYLGKIGISDDNENIVTVDWRSPIASLYYDSNVGNCSFDSPNGIIKGELLLKRQYDIENGILKDFYNTDSVSNDELLKPYLTVSADDRLKNIVSTIQSEQNKIIREKLSKNLIVQGVAGSGKTTVALHRIAYLVYTYKNMIKNSQYIIIGPNKFFINYISKVLPDLDIVGIKQLDINEFCSLYIAEDIIFLGNSKNREIGIYKTSMKFKNIIDEYMSNYENVVVGEDDFIIDGFKVLSNKRIKNIYYDKENSYTSISERVNKAILMISRFIKCHSEFLIEKSNNYIDELFFKSDDKEYLGKLKKRRESLKKEINSGCINSLKKYFSKSNAKVSVLYDNLINNIDKYTDEVKLPKINKKVYTTEDVPALLYIKYLLSDNGKYNQIKQTVIDEAQDYSDFHFIMLNKIFKNSTFSIFGDLAQSIYSYKSIKSWNSVEDMTFDKNVETLYLSKSYRTTIEIMSEANKINRHLNLTEANAVIRHGSEVHYVNTDLLEKDYIKELVKSLLKNNYNTIGIISKTDKDSDLLYEELKDSIKLNNINYKNEKYTGGVCTITSSLSKGLEFDAVIINNVDNNNFDINNDLDMKLLYVAMTRPLHELYVLYNKEMCNVLKN